MFGFVFIGMALGAAAAGAVILTGAPLFSGVALYSVVGTPIAFRIAMLSFAISQRRESSDIEAVAGHYRVPVRSPRTSVHGGGWEEHPDVHFS